MDNLICPSCGCEFNSKLWGTTLEPGICPQCNYSGNRKRFYNSIRSKSYSHKNVVSEISLNTIV